MTLIFQSTLLMSRLIRDPDLQWIPNHSERMLVGTLLAKGPSTPSRHGGYFMLHGGIFSVFWDFSYIVVYFLRARLFLTLLAVSLATL